VDDKLFEGLVQIYVFEEGKECFQCQIVYVAHRLDPESAGKASSLKIEQQKQHSAEAIQVRGGPRNAGYVYRLSSRALAAAHHSPAAKLREQRIQIV
jgi:hypothetical protein